MGVCTSIVPEMQRFWVVPAKVVVLPQVEVNEAEGFMFMLV